MGRIQYAKLGKPENREIEDAYFARLKESDGFDLSGVFIPGAAPVVPCDVQDSDYDCKLLVQLYARLGLHRYSLLRGEDLELEEIMAFNRSRYYPATYYITLMAIHAGTGIRKVFQVKVGEMTMGYLNCRCSIARPQGTRDPHTPLCGGMSDYLDYRSLPDWAESEDAFSDTSRFYEVKESEVEEHSWIRLYMELVVSTSPLQDHLDRVAHLKIVKVVIETDQVVEEPLKATSVTVYIKFKNTDRYKVGKGTNRIAIVKRFFNETTRQFVVVGKSVNTDEQRSRSKLAKTERRVSTRTRNPIQRFGT